MKIAKIDNWNCTHPFTSPLTFLCVQKKWIKQNDCGLHRMKNRQESYHHPILDSEVVVSSILAWDIHSQNPEANFTHFWKGLIRLSLIDSKELQVATQAKNYNIDNFNKV